MALISQLNIVQIEPIFTTPPFGYRSLKQNASLAKSPTRTETTQTNHFVAALSAFVKIELLKVQTNKNHYQLKAQLYFAALQQAFQELQKLQSELSQQPSSA